jgi:hypothetical protein
MAMSASVASAVWPVLQKVGLGRLPGGIVIERENFRLVTRSSSASFSRWFFGC